METGAAASFYRRPLPDGQIGFSSAEGRALFREALAAGGLENWFALAEQFHTQSDPAFCGLGSLVMVLNALEIDPQRIWKGPWRWYGEELLDCCLPLDAIRQHGLTLEELACLARCNGAASRVERPEMADVARFREQVRAAAATPRGPVMVVSYLRTALGQTGSGHFSPVGGFHEERDLVLILDVARFKYPPHWVPLAQLWEAMRPVDPASGRSRGWVILERGQAPLAFHLRLLWDRCGGTRGTAVLAAMMAQLQGAEQVADLVAAVEAHLGGALATPAAELAGASDAVARVQALLAELRATAMQELVRGARRQSGGVPDEMIALLLLALPETMLPRLAADAQKALAAARQVGTAALSAEVGSLREQLAMVARWDRAGCVVRDR